MHDHEELCKKLNVLENSTSLKKSGMSIATKCSDTVWNNDDVNADRINFVQKS